MKNTEKLHNWIEENKEEFKSQILKYVEVYETIDKYLLEMGVNDSSKRDWMINDIVNNSVEFNEWEKQHLNG